MAAAELCFDNKQCCFLRCSKDVFKSLANNLSCNVIKLTCSEKTFFFKTSLDPEASNGSVYLNTNYAETLGLCEGTCSIEPQLKVLQISSVKFCCVSDTDYSICEVNKDILEMGVLNQVSILNENVPFLVWLSKSSVVKLYPQDIQPKDAQMLTELTKVVIDTPLSGHVVKSTRLKSPATRLICKISCIDLNTEENNHLPIASLCCSCQNSSMISRSAFVSEPLNEKHEFFMVKLLACPKCCFSDEFKIVTVEAQLQCYFKDNALIIIEFCEDLNNELSVIIPNAGLIYCPNILPPSCSIVSVFKEKDKLISIAINKTGQKLSHVSSSQVPERKLTKISPCLPHFDVLDEIIDQLLTTYTWNYKSLSLLTTKSSTPKIGKTLLLKALECDLRLNKFFISYKNVTTLRGKRLDNIIKELTEYLNICYLNQPSILLLDNLDATLPPKSKDEDPTADQLFSTRLAYKILELFNKYSRLYVDIIISTQTQETCHSVLLNNCTDIYFLPVLNAREQVKVLNTFDVSATEKDLQSLSLKSNLSIGEVFKLKQILVDNDYDFTECSDIIQIFELSKKKDSTSTLRLTDCGGLSEVKDEINKMLVLPTLYPDLFAQIRFPLNRGILLYGCPGVGKTHIVKAIANEINMSFMVVKGPELLNKYIGASEQAVRNLFLKARQNSPTLIFFDEFDSLAPTRGNDTTGVMDRVVNQLLTELDGISKKADVYVIAATSRPDVIDSALLRPGRIGRKVFCPVPAPDERKAIWKCLLKDVKHDSSIDTSVLASKTQYYTGADIKAVIYNAQLKFLQKLNKSGKKNQEMNMNDIVSVISETPPSLRKADLQSYEKTYDLFLSGKISQVGYKVTQM